DGRPSEARLGGEDRAQCVRQRVASERVAADRRGLEQGQPFEGTLDSGRIRLDDAIPVHEQSNRRPLTVARRVSEGLDHRLTVARRGAEAPLRVSTLPMEPELCEPERTQVGATPFLGKASVGTPAPFM